MGVCARRQEGPRPWVGRGAVLQAAPWPPSKSRAAGAAADSVVRCLVATTAAPEHRGAPATRRTHRPDDRQRCGRDVGRCLRPTRMAASHDEPQQQQRAGVGEDPAAAPAGGGRSRLRGRGSEKKGVVAEAAGRATVDVVAVRVGPQPQSGAGTDWPVFRTGPGCRGVLARMSTLMLRGQPGPYLAPLRRAAWPIGPGHAVLRILRRDWPEVHRRPVTHEQRAKRR